ncbi:MAG: VTT domain-containing protein [Hyphomicrobiaceae bacterium]
MEQTRLSIADAPMPPSASFGWKRFVPLVLLVGVIAAFFGFGLHGYLTFDQLRQHRGELMAFVAGMPAKAVLIFIAVYAGATALSLPGGVVLTLSGGFLFGIWQGTAAVVIGATIGATAIFLAARFLFAEVLRAKAGPWLARMEAGFRKDAASYLLVLRLVPGFPFFVVNLVPAFLGVPLGLFVLTTLFGIIPGTFVFASIGAGLGSIFDQMAEFSLKGALTPQVVTALIGLAALSLIPVVYKRLAARRAGAA